MSDPSYPTTSPVPSPNGAIAPKMAIDHDLPPVEAPTAGFIIQLFVIPGVIVFVVILVWLLFGKLAGGERDAMEYVRTMRSSAGNPRAAQRAAFELAGLIRNDPKLSADPKLLGEMTDLLEHDLDTVENPEMSEYVAFAIGRFQTLDAISSSGQKIDPLSALDRALDPKYPTAIRSAAAVALAMQAARLKGKLDDASTVAALTRSASTGDEQVRKLSVYALGFFGGDAATAGLKERLLSDEDRDVRYNAAIALGRRGDPVAAATFREMLNPADLDRVTISESPTEKRSRIEAIELEALSALQTSATEGKPALARLLRPQVDGLTRSGLVSVRNRAQALAQVLGSTRESSR